MFCRRSGKLPPRFLDPSSCMCTSRRAFKKILSFSPTGHGKRLALVFVLLSHFLKHAYAILACVDEIAVIMI